MTVPAGDLPGAAGGTRPFSRFEWMIAGRYLRARRRDAGVSVIAGFSFVGIMLGVAALIIVMSVMNGSTSQPRSRRPTMSRSRSDRTVSMQLR